MKNDSFKMRVSFDLDEVLFVSPDTHKTEPQLPLPLRLIYKERLRQGTPELIRSLQQLGYEVWIYTSSFRSEKYIRHYFRLHGIRLDQIVNADRHLKEVQGGHSETLPQKMPSHYRISLHVDDEYVIYHAGKQYGFNVYHLDAEDNQWKEKIIERAEEIRKHTLEGRPVPKSADRIQLRK